MQLTTKSGPNRVHICRPGDLDETLCGVGAQEWAWDLPDDTPEHDIPALCRRCALKHYKPSHFEPLAVEGET